MDVQMKRGLLDVCVLSAIKMNDGISYGYQIIKDIKPYVEMSESTLYPILRRLETGSYLTSTSREHNGRLRKYYHLTPEGLRKIDSFAEDFREITSIYNFVSQENKKTPKTPEN